MSIELADAELELARREAELEALRAEMRLLYERESRLKRIVAAWRTITETAAAAATRRDQSESNEEKPELMCVECRPGVTVGTGEPFVTMMAGAGVVRMSPELARRCARAIMKAADESVEMEMASRATQTE